MKTLTNKYLENGVAMIETIIYDIDGYEKYHIKRPMTLQEKEDWKKELYAIEMANEESERAKRQRTLRRP